MSELNSDPPLSILSTLSTLYPSPFFASSFPFIHPSSLSLLSIYPLSYALIVSYTCTLPTLIPQDVHWQTPEVSRCPLCRTDLSATHCEAVHTTAPRYITDFQSPSPSINLLHFLCHTPCLLPSLLTIKHLTFQKRSYDPLLLIWQSFTSFSLPHCHNYTLTHTHTHTPHTHTYTLTPLTHIHSHSYTCTYSCTRTDWHTHIQSDTKLTLCWNISTLIAM